MEQFLLHQLQQRLNSSSDLNCTMMFDFHRAMRYNKKSLLQLQQFTANNSDQKLNISLFSHPTHAKLKKIISYSPILEGMGVHHIKAAVFDDDILNKKEVQLLLNNIKHLIGKNIEIGVLTARSDRKKHANLLNKLRVKLKEYGLEIDKIYFVSESIRAIGYQDKVVYDKNNILLTHLIGLGIEDNHFVPIKKDCFNKVHFYDDIKSNFMSINNLQDYFDFLVRNSDQDCIEFINNRLESGNLTIVNNLITNNELNPFETKTIKLNSPIKFPIKVVDNKLTVKFENFKKY